MIFGEDYQVHRIVWKIYYGINSPDILDHINRIKLDNRIENLRESSNSLNQRNIEVNSTNTSGHRGVCRGRNKWRAYITVDEVRIFLGHYSLKSEAVIARRVAERHYGFTQHKIQKPKKIKTFNRL